MVTTIIAIYGAVVATLSLLLTGWIFVSSGPKVQTEASLYRPSADKPDGWRIYLHVWNTGRQSIKVDIRGLILAELESPPDKWQLSLRKRKPTLGQLGHLALKWDGPEFPIMLAAHSGEHWRGISPAIANSEFLAFFSDYLGTAIPRSDPPTKLLILLEVGGRRKIEVPVADRPTRVVKRQAKPPSQ
jgi:hypothetical protein